MVVNYQTKRGAENDEATGIGKKARRKTNRAVRTKRSQREHVSRTHQVKTTKTFKTSSSRKKLAGKCSPNNSRQREKKRRKEKLSEESDPMRV